jgi:stage II sporulation protein P
MIGAFAAGVFCCYMVFTTAPEISKRLSSLTAASAELSFFGSDNTASQSSQTTELTQDSLTESFSVNDDAGLLTELENSSSEEVQADTSAEIPTRPDNAGSVVRKTLTYGQSSVYVPLEHGFVKNQTSLSYEEVQSLGKTKPEIKLENTSEPQVLIYHTHATESYQPYQVDWYDPSYNARSADDSENMVAVGNVLAEKLEAAGIGVIHDTTHHDETYTGAYDRSRETIEKYLKQYPSIKVVLDVHRDALQGDNVITAPVTTINGKSTAQVMIISCAGTSSKPIPNYKQNFSFACMLQNQMEGDYPTLTRPILFDDRHYNQDLSVGALLIEVGGHGNTLEEAENAISLVGDSLIKVLKSLS